MFGCQQILFVCTTVSIVFLEPIYVNTKYMLYIYYYTLISHRHVICDYRQPLSWGPNTINIYIQCPAKRYAVIFYATTNFKLAAVIFDDQYRKNGYLKILYNTKLITL